MRTVPSRPKSWPATRWAQRLKDADLYNPDPGATRQAVQLGGIKHTVAERLGIAQPTASQQLALLRRSGLLVSRKHGKQVFYRIDAATVERSLIELQTYLRTCCPPPGQQAV